MGMKESEIRAGMRLDCKNFLSNGCLFLPKKAATAPLRYPPNTSFARIVDKSAPELRKKWAPIPILTLLFFLIIYICGRIIGHASILCQKIFNFSIFAKVYFIIPHLNATTVSFFDLFLSFWI